jgi:hypothetical protein
MLRVCPAHQHPYPCRYGAHCDNYPTPYFSVACAIGICDADVNLFLRRLDKALGEWKSVPASRLRPPPVPPEDEKPASSERGRSGGPSDGKEASSGHGEVL